MERYRTFNSFNVNLGKVKRILFIVFSEFLNFILYFRLNENLKRIILMTNLLVLYTVDYNEVNLREKLET